MSDFHERLRQRKQELLTEKLPPPQETISSDDVRRYEMEERVRKFKQSAIKIMIGACLFMGFFSYCIFKDWYGFVGSREYVEWKERVESDN